MIFLVALVVGVICALVVHWRGLAVLCCAATTVFLFSCLVSATARAHALHFVGALILTQAAYLATLFAADAVLKQSFIQRKLRSLKKQR